MSNDRTLEEMVTLGKALVALMTPEEVAAMTRAQGESLARNYKPGPRQCYVIKEPTK